MENQILSYCRISNHQVWLNGREVCVDHDASELPTFLGKVYKHLNVSYPKFFKMDKLCKLAFLATECLIKEEPELLSLPKQDLALVFSNHASSLDTDRQHQQSINDKSHYFPSPSVFVYTLPNIMLGEIAIRHKITGENAFFISEKFDASLLCSYTDLLLENGAAQAVLCGWVNVDENAAEAFVYCVKKTNFNGDKEATSLPHNPQQTHLLYLNGYGSTGNHPKT